MTDAERSGRTEWLSITCVTGAVFIELFIRERFHRLGAYAPLIIVSAWWVFLLCGTVACAKSRRLRRFNVSVERLALLMATAVSVYMLAPASAVALDGSLGSAAKLAACAVILWLCWLLAVHVSISRWGQLRWAVSVGFLVFVTSQPFIAAARAPRISWPSWPGPHLADSVANSKSAQIFLLLDELNFSASSPIVDVLKRNGIAVRIKPLQPTGDGTAKVVPAMFSGGNFENAKPCGPDVFCGKSDVVDFSKIYASRPDVDVIGFAMPYCAIRGLRSCERVPFKLKILDWKLWICSAMRRLGHRPPQMYNICADMHREAWENLENEVEAAMWRAPLWKEGGFLYAHIALPHPPGNGPASSLKADYTASVERAAQLVEKIIVRAKDEGIVTFSLVVFSDHPLRNWIWCDDLIYANYPCTSRDNLTDTRVPLIVAGDLLPSIETIDSNRDVFRLTYVKVTRPK